MYSDKDILARLQRGEKAEDIAKEMTAQLNAAVDQKKKADEAVAKKKASTQHLKTAATEINAYLQEQFPDDAKRGVSITPAELEEMIRAVVKTDRGMNYLDKLEKEFYKSGSKAFDPISKFIKGCDFM